MFSNSELLLEGITDGLIYLDKNGFIQYCNPAVTVLTGYKEDELIDQPLYIFYNNKDDSMRTEYEMMQAFKKGNFSSEGWKTMKDGSKFWGETRLSPLFENNSHTGFACILRNTSERKKAELELRQSEERYRLMVDGVKDYAIFMLDVEGNIVTWNEGAKKTKGYMASEIIGKHFSIFYTSIDLENRKPEREIEIATKAGKYEEEGWRVKKNGSVFWANIVLTALHNEQNKLVGFSKVTRDLTERKFREEELRQSEERYMSLVEQVTDYGIFMLDDKGRIISWNEGAKRIKGYTVDEILGKYFSIFYPEEEIINGKPEYELRVAKSEGKFEEEGWRIRKDGSRFWANIVITAVYNKNDQLLGFSKVTRDLTERKEGERALRESYENYRLLANEMKKTNLELSEANKELEQFTSIVSHDLQEPIRTIKSFLQLIDLNLTAAQNEDLKIYIQKSINAANRMRELIQNLLHYSQLSKGELVEENVLVKDLFNEVMQNLKTAVEGSDAIISFECEVDAVRGDKVQLVQLLQNLVTNALKFTNGGRPEVTINCKKENGVVKFAVADKGIGIAEGDMRKIFEIFKRLNTKKSYPGMGIGLAICKKIVERHNGRIWPESTPGEGTTFYFTIGESTKESTQV